jgi:hypothetical protein
MAVQIKIAALVLVAAFGLWPAFQNGVGGRLSSAWNCAASRSLIWLRR